MSPVFYALLSAFFAALVAIFGKIGLQKIDSTLATTARSIVMALFLVMVSFAFQKFESLDTLTSKALLFILLSGIAGALSWLFYFFAIKNGTVSAVVAVDRTSIIFAVILAAIFLGESLTWQKAFGAVLVAGGAFLITAK